MKVKLDFVTNSSSTCFMIADFKKPLDDLDIMGQFDVSGSYDPIKSIEELKECDTFGYYFNDDGSRSKKEMNLWRQREFDGCADAINRGAVVYIFWASSDSNDLVEAGLRQRGVDENDFNREPGEIEIVSQD